MKNIFLNIAGGVLLFLSANVNAQIISNGNVTSTLNNTNYFMDGSNFEGLANQSYGRGLGFPRTNLTTFTFDTSPMDNTVIVSDFDGMVVYNTATGNTAAGQGVTTAVAPGFYYFSNPGNPGNITNGRWVPMGGAGKVNVFTTETATNTLVDNKQVYAIKGTFTASGTSTAVNIPAPSGMTAMYGITIYKAGTNIVYDRSLYSYTVATTAGNAITGSPSMSVVYPADTYDYVLEYLK
ncbi:hypothetical protein DRF59_15305 [Chryseobacterium flavum]|uniref:Calcium-binding protein n=1 Tax=Chryseobacterium flavum TaxID=415851 RepID=A0A3D9CIH3_9FLAO|nr:hypothetical protein [Chryseobacterium flavum]REC65547.1 hypothetical protein DRF59_15305 [Chryseobacterium flavum]